MSGLLSWYDENRRILPWREDPTPYHVWLSEIMLQQTRVEAVIGYYNRFLAALPTIRDLALADEDVYLKLWEGLGYYSRVRNLHRAAVMIEDDYGGVMPGKSRELLALPGIGPYTAAAIASIAFGEAVPAVDGNLLRVYARQTLCKASLKDPKTKKEATSWYQERIPNDRPGAWNQALMDLGATICLPNGAPHCDLCPVSDTCRAHLAGCEESVPVPDVKKPRRVENRTVLILTCGEYVVLKKRPEKGLLAGLYEFPNIEGSSDLKTFLDAAGLCPVFAGIPLPAAKHVFTHIEWHMTGIQCEVRVQDTERFEDTGCFLAGRTELDSTYSIPSAFSSYRRLV